MSNQRYPTDTTDAQWEILRGLIPPKQGRGRPTEVDLRRVVDAIFYQCKSGAPYRLLPKDFPPWNTVYYYFRKWSRNGLLRALHDALREQVRKQQRPMPRTTASADSQTTDSAGAREARGFDGGK